MMTLITATSCESGMPSGERERERERERPWEAGGDAFKARVEDKCVHSHRWKCMHCTDRPYPHVPDFLPTWRDFLLLLLKNLGQICVRSPAGNPSICRLLLWFFTHRVKIQPSPLSLSLSLSLSLQQFEDLFSPFINQFPNNNNSNNSQKIFQTRRRRPLALFCVRRARAELKPLLLKGGLNCCFGWMDVVVSGGATFEDGAKAKNLFPAAWILCRN